MLPTAPKLVTESDPILDYNPLPRAAAKEERAGAEGQAVILGTL